MFEKTIQIFWEELLKLSPNFIWAGLVLIFGIFISSLFAKLSTSFLNRFRINQLLERIGMKKIFEKVEIKLDFSKFFGQLVKWFFLLIFLMICAEILGLSRFAQFLEKIVEYFPNIFIACLIFIISAFLFDFSQKVVIGTLEKEKIVYSRFLGKELSLAIWILTILAILYQLKIVPELFLILFVGVIFTLSLSLGISFGLGGKEIASKILKDLEERFKK